MKDEFNKEHDLVRHLDSYKVDVPSKLYVKQTVWQRVIRYVASPAKNPFDKILETAIGLRSMWILPVVSGVFVTLMQFAIWLIN